MMDPKQIQGSLLTSTLVTKHIATSPVKGGKWRRRRDGGGGGGGIGREGRWRGSCDQDLSFAGSLFMTSSL